MRSASMASIETDAGTQRSRANVAHMRQSRPDFGPPRGLQCAQELTGGCWGGVPGVEGGRDHKTPHTALYCHFMKWRWSFVRRVCMPVENDLPGVEGGGEAVEVDGLDRD